MLVNVSGCSGPSAFELISITCTSFHRSASFVASPTIAILISVSACSLLKSYILTLIDIFDLFLLHPRFLIATPIMSICTVAEPTFLASLYS